MAQTVTLNASVRERAGKGAARAVRREGRVPAVIYGDKKDPQTISMDYRELMKQVQTGRFLSTLIDIDVDGSKVRTIPRDVQFDPVRDFVVHVDFLRLGKGARIAVEVAINFLGDEDSPGLKRGGVLNVVRHTVEIMCPADAIPESFDMDISELDIGDGLHSTDLTLPEGMAFTITDRDFTIATISAPSGGADEDEEDAAVEGEEGAEGEEVEGGEDAAGEGEGGEE
ncbi:MAG: 50S ribosomal protein L25/general stress protein Ctc [Anderseniella sp.]|nr:50S ribosomal protein L25/general stress protein Ctc [Anderseniella sp.]